MFNTILVPTDGSGHAAKAIDLAADLASKYGSRVVLMHVLMRGALPEAVKALVDSSTLSRTLQSEYDSLYTEVARPVEAMSMGSAFVPVSPSIELLQAVAGQILDKGKARAEAKGVRNVETQIADGDAAHAIVDCASREKADCIVMGSRGLGHLKGMMMGSVSHKVASLATCTCITVK